VPRTDRRQNRDAYDDCAHHGGSTGGDDDPPFATRGPKPLPGIETAEHAACDR
jgi:hypothetical protein